MFWRWAKHIGLLQTAPHYPIPVELSIGLLMEFSTDIPAKNCELHGGWYGACNRTLKLWSFDCMILCIPFLRSDGMGWCCRSGRDRRKCWHAQCTLHRCPHKRRQVKDLLVEHLHCPNHCVGPGQVTVFLKYRRQFT